MKRAPPNLKGGVTSNAENLAVGNTWSRTATINQSGNSTIVNTGNNLLLGETASTGVYNLSGGTLTAFASMVGDTGSGVFNQTGGTHNPTWTSLGFQTGSPGGYHLSDGTLTDSL